MPRLSRTPSPAVSPTTIPQAKMKPAIMMPTVAAPVTYIPPLRDGACGTTPRSQQPLWTVARHELTQMLRMMPALCWAMLVQRKHVSWADRAAMAVHTLLACLEMAVMLTAVPLWLVLPGAVFAAWVCACAGMVMALCWVVNGKEQMYQYAAASEGWMMGQETDDEKWMFLGGMGTSSRHCHRQTLPALSRLFGRPMTCICLRTYGMPFDMVAVMLQRCIPIPSQARRNLYSQMRCALLDDSMNRCVVLAHNDSAIIVSQAVAQLCADVTAEKLAKLEIYTVGAAACEFVMPLGNLNTEPEPVHPSSDVPDDNQGIHVEHFAMTDDPFAQLGVLQSVRQNMDGRFCGGVFIMNNTNAPPTSPRKPAGHRAVPSYSGLTMEEYLTALFPAQMRTGAAVQSSVLDSVMTVDRDCAEKREIAAMSNYHAASQARRGGSGAGGGGKRLSWTGLGLTNVTTPGAHRNGMNLGLVALEMARKGCKNCDGHRGREVTWLVRYVNVEVGGAKQAADGVNGMRRTS
ncbi:hypothetical protein MFIFM68171_06364 [Madurella fahalii]|uniref:Uncharacterized protein n=1 Tax=Madurella fahalii TaxID=1157608 RepID=A0ABQ0GEQ7_9PEZI